MFSLLKNLFKLTNDRDIREAIKEGAFMVDVRTPAEFAGGSITSAVNIPLDKITAQLAKFKDKQNIIVFCMSGNRSNQAKRILEENGFRNVINGGGWQQLRSLISQ